MDTLTHGLAGALLARAMPSTGDAGLDGTLRRREAWVGFLAALFPDTDVLLSPFSAEFYIEQHRGVTHSFLLLPLWAILLGALASLRLPPGVKRRQAFGRLAVVSGLGLLSHILLDWVTSWGTMFFAPLSWDRYALDWVFILDFVLSGLLILGLVSTRALTKRSDAWGRRAARVALVAAAGYVGLCAQRHHEAEAIGARLAPPGALRCAALAQPLSPNRWLLISDDGVALRVHYVDLGRRAGESEPAPPLEVFERLGIAEMGALPFLRQLDAPYRSPDDPRTRLIPKADGPLARRVLDEGMNGIFGRFARFPAARETAGPGGGVNVTLRDARFGYLSKRTDPFTYEVRYDASGHLVSAGFPSSRWLRPSAAAASVGATR
jgi:inner membrane protein